MFRPAKAFAILLIGSCAIDAPFEPSPAYQYEPPPVYAEWWGEVESCSGRRGRLETVSFFSVPDAIDGDGESWFPCPQIGRCGGYWKPGRIYVAQGLELYRPVVAHEMLHELIGSASHGLPFYACKLIR